MTNCIYSGTSDSFGTAVTQLHYENAGKDVRMSTTYVIHARGLNTPLSVFRRTDMVHYTTLSGGVDSTHACVRVCGCGSL